MFVWKECGVGRPDPVDAGSTSHVRIHPSRTKEIEVYRIHCERQQAEQQRIDCLPGSSGGGL